MSTIANAVFTKDDSDSENDPDFVPADDEPSDDDERVKGEKSGSKQDDGGDEEEKEKARQARAALWADFQASVSSSSSKAPETAAPTPPQTKLVKIEKRYRFAGEDVVEVVEVPEDSQDANKWPRWRSTSEETSGLILTHGLSEPSAQVASSSTSISGSEIPSTSIDDSTTAATATASSSTPKTKPKPGPRKSKTVLPSLPSGKPKKLSTLEKSAMDWRAHLGEQDGGAVDELERNRRAGGGGYLEKVEFMDRVEGRREEIFEREKGAKRRKV